jgi:hypothetical protein
MSQRGCCAAKSPRSYPFTRRLTNRRKAAALHLSSEHSAEGCIKHHGAPVDEVGGSATPMDVGISSVTDEAYKWVNISSMGGYHGRPGFPYECRPDYSSLV